MNSKLPSLFWPLLHRREARYTSRLNVAALVAFLLQLLVPTGSTASAFKVRINEILAGANGDSSIQFVELVAENDSQKAWGPGENGKVGRARLVFLDKTGKITGRFVFPSDARPGAATVLVATAEFESSTGLSPDFIMPKLVVPNAGTVVFENNPDAASISESFQTFFSYGGASTSSMGSIEAPPNPDPLPILGAKSLSRFQNFGSQSFNSLTHRNLDFSPAPPTPAGTQAQGNADLLTRNLIGEVELKEETLSIQGENLFKRESFAGNGRTCRTCHLPMDRYALSPARINSLHRSDPLFVHEMNLNKLEVTSAGSAWPDAPSGASQPSDFSGVISGTLGGTATVLSGSGGIYWILGGQDLNIPGNIIRDGAGNRGMLKSFTPGNLNGATAGTGAHLGLEDSVHLRGPAGLILVNPNGFSKPPVFRSPPSLLNLKHTAPYGLSGDFETLESFTTNAIKQHFTRRMEREEGPDFRMPTGKEIQALVAFQKSIVFPLNENFDETNRFERFLVTDVERHGRNQFFAFGKCSVCHDGKTLSHSDGRFGTTSGINESFDTGVTRLKVAIDQNLPPEQENGVVSAQRRFNVPALMGVKRTGPYFHNGILGSLPGAVSFYDTPEFKNSEAVRSFPSPEGFDAVSIAAFLRALGREAYPPPSIYQPVTTHHLNDNAWARPFAEATISGRSSDQILDMVVEIDKPEVGAFTSGSEGDHRTRSIVTQKGNPSVIQEFLRRLIFRPRSGRLPPGAEESTTITLTLKDGINFPETDSTTTLIIHPSNGRLSISPIKNLIVPIGSNPPLIQFQVMGVGPNANPPVLRASSSNKLLVRDEGLSISRSADGYTLTISPIPHRKGITILTIESDGGQEAARQSFQLVMMPTETTTFVGPLGAETHDWLGGGPGLTFAESDFRVQQIHPAGPFPDAIIAIRKLGYRRSEYDAQVSATLDDLEVTLSTSKMPILYKTFSTNLSADASRVFRGPVTLTSRSSRLAATQFPPYEISIPLQSPFIYHPESGDLLIEYKNYNGSKPWIAIDSYLVPPERSLFEWSTGAATGQMTSYQGWTEITEFTTSILATPPEIRPISDLAVPPGTTMIDIHLTITDKEIPSDELMLSATTTDPGLLDPGTFVFHGSGSERKLQFPVPNGKRGISHATVSVSDGTFTRSRSFNIGLGQVSRNSLVPLPLESATRANWSFVSERREHTVISSRLFPPTPVWITDIRFRSAYRNRNFSELPEISVHLSTTTADPGMDNMGTANLPLGTRTYHGRPRDNRINQVASGNNPAFDVIIPFDRPFYYQPVNGNLLIDIENFFGLGTLAVYAVPRHLADGKVQTTAVRLDRSVHPTSSDPTYLEVSYFVTGDTQPGPLILDSPLDLQVAVGGNATFFVRTDPSIPLYFQWFHNGGLIPGASQPTLLLQGVNAGNAGSYAVRVSNGTFEQTSAQALLSVTGGKFGFEADILPRPGGKNTGTISLSDWVKIGRFAAGLETVESVHEFRRADCAPKSTRGDGRITTADWVQAGRYAAGLDFPAQAGGPEVTDVSTP